MERILRKWASALALIAAIAAAAAVLTLSTNDLSTASSQTLKFTAIDVGQGDSFLFKFPDGTNMLVDAGPSGGAASLVAKLRRLGVRRIDLLVATHPHEDHIGAMPRVVREFEIGRVWDSGFNHGSSFQRRFLKEVQSAGVKLTRLKAGFKEDVGGAHIEVLAPTRLLAETHSDPNNNSIVMRVEYGQVSFLMMADAEGEERGCVSKFPRSTILKAGHHGSHNGTDARLMEQVRPAAVVLSYAVGNEYGHPHEKTLRLLKKYGSEVYATASGDITIETDGKSWSASVRHI